MRLTEDIFLSIIDTVFAGGEKLKRFKDWLIRFMYGRYGVDQLYYGLFGLWIILTVVGTFTRSIIVSAITSVIVVFMIFRTFSKNHTARRRENEVFMKLWRPIRNWFTYQRDKFRDRKTSRYRKCPACRAIIKFPNKKGKHTAVCPKCKHRFNVKI